MELKKPIKLIALVLVCIVAVGFLLPASIVIPVSGASKQDWNHNTFWHEPWGKSGVHKGIDIFSAMGAQVIAATHGIVIYAGELKRGGNVVIVLGPKWRAHYYAHLNDIDVQTGDFVSTSEKLGSVGDTGNAKGKQPHLHYSIVTLLPYPWRWDTSTQGWKKVFFLNPVEQLANVP